MSILTSLFGLLLVLFGLLLLEVVKYERRRSAHLDQIVGKMFHGTDATPTLSPEPQKMISIIIYLILTVSALLILVGIKANATIP